MIGPRLRRIAGRPALHVLIAFLFLCAFVWPLFAIARPWITWVYLQVVWLGCIGALYFVSRGENPREDDEDEPEAAGSTKAEDV